MFSLLIVSLKDGICLVDEKLPENEETISFLADMCPQILKMHQERFLTKGSFFARSPHQQIASIPRAPKARAKKKLKISWEILRQIYPKMTL